MTSGDIKRVKKLQLLSYNIYLSTIRHLKVNMSEVDIATFISEQYKKKGVESYWYDVPMMVLISEERFLEMTKDYNTKSPLTTYRLKSGNTIHIDLTPKDKEGFWGDFSATCVFHPKTDYDFEKVEFLRLVRKIQRDGIKRIKSVNQGSNIANWYLGKFRENNMTLVDVRNNVGHSIHQGTKKFPDGRGKRNFLDVNNNNPIGEGIFAIEPGGYRESSIDKNKIVVGRFEDCIYVSTSQIPLLLAPKKEIPFII